MADLHFLRLERQARLEGNEEALAAAEELKQQELDMVGRADCTITHSTVEGEILAQAAPESAVVVWPLMVEKTGTTASLDTRRDICFLGGYGHPPNVDAVLYFVREVFPIIKKSAPEMRFIVGVTARLRGSVEPKPHCLVSIWHRASGRLDLIARHGHPGQIAVHGGYSG